MVLALLTRNEPSNGTRYSDSGASNMVSPFFVVSLFMLSQRPCDVLGYEF